MKYKIYLTIAVTIMTFFKCNSNEQKFWKWFNKNQIILFDFEINQEEIFDELNYQLKLVNEDLTFEFGPKINGKREFVISADGIETAFPSVISLYESAPKLEKWDIIKFRPRRFPLNEIHYNNIEIKVDDVRFILIKDNDPNKVGIILFIKNYNKNKENTFKSIGYLYLDEALGEYDVETKIGVIIFESPKSKYNKESFPLKELAKMFDEHFKNE